MTTTETTTEVKNEQRFIDASIKLRKGTAEDFRVTNYSKEGSVTKTTYTPKYGQPYWLRSLKTGKVDNRNYQITEDTDWDEFKQYLRLEMIYVPAGYFELKGED